MYRETQMRLRDKKIDKLILTLLSFLIPCNEAIRNISITHLIKLFIHNKERRWWRRGSWWRWQAIHAKTLPHNKRRWKRRRRYVKLHTKEPKFRTPFTSVASPWIVTHIPTMWAFSCHSCLDKMTIFHFHKLTIITRRNRLISEKKYFFDN